MNKNVAKPSWAKEVQKGYLKLLILMMLTRKPMHGYEIMDKVHKRTLGLWRPTAGGVYPLLKRMERKGEVKAKWIIASGRRRRVYQTTHEGMSRLNKALEKQKALIDTIDGLYADFMAEVLEVDQKPEFPMFSLFREVFSYEDSRMKTAEEKKELLLSIKKRLERLERNVNTGIKEVEKRLRQIKPA
jgi:DNA-binding PadR family transcriptional regulator